MHVIYSYTFNKANDRFLAQTKITSNTSMNLQGLMHIKYISKELQKTTVCHFCKILNISDVKGKKKWKISD